MSVTVKLNLPLQKLAGDKERIEVTGNTVKECLDNLMKRLPGAEKNLYPMDGFLRPLISLNNNHLPQDELDREVKDGDELRIITMMVGG